MKYRYRTWCRYCVGEDPEYAVCDTFPDTSEETFDTPGEAKQAAEDCCEGSNLDYEVVDEDGKEVEVEA